MNGADFSLDVWQIRLVLPHRPPVLQLDQVTSCAASLDRLEAIKALGGSDPMMQHKAGSLGSGAVIEALAQCCGLLLRLRWLACHGADLQAFAAGDNSQVLDRDIPRSVLAESDARFGGGFTPGQTLRLATRLVLSRGEMHRFEASVAAGSKETPLKTATVRIMLNFPRLPAAATDISSTVSTAKDATC